MTFVPRLFDYAASGNCLKVRMLLNLLGRPFERVPVDIFGGGTLTEEFARINPLRTTPVAEIAPGRHLPESNALLVHFAEGTRLLPEDALDRADVLRWLFFERSFTPAVGGLRFMRMTGRDGDAAAVRETAATGNHLLDVLDQHLAGRSFVAADDLTVADLALHAYAHVAPDAGFDLERRPALRAWIERVEAAPGFVNDLEPYPPNARVGSSRSIYE